MKLKNMKKEELEALSYTDLTEMIIKENKVAMKTPDIFRTICSLLSLSDEEYANQIGDFYTSLTTDKRFILLESAEWDLRDKHKIEIVLDEDDEDDMELSLEEESEDEIVEEESELDSIDMDEEIELDDENDIDDLTIVDDLDEDIE